MSKPEKESHAVVQVTSAEWQSGAVNTKENSMSQLDLLPVTRHTGLAIGHKKAEDAAKHAGNDWLEQALEAFKHYATTHKKFTTEEVRSAYPDLPEPPDKRAWGAVPRIAKKDGLISAHGWTRANSHTVHGMVVTMWESRIYKGETYEPN